MARLGSWPLCVRRVVAGMLLLSCSVTAMALSGKVVDGTSGKAIAGAWVTLGDRVIQTDGQGVFSFETATDKIGLRAYGYGRREVAVAHSSTGLQEFRLEPFAPKALYLSYYGIGDRQLRRAALDLLDRTELNALVIDVKGDRGRVPYRSTVPLAAATQGQKAPIIKDIRELMSSLREKGVYTIARIVVFKDDPLATDRPDLAVKKADGTIWRDNEGLAWADPFRKEVWNYNLDLAAEAAANGFDEIQFDYVRFPDAPGGLVFSQPATAKSRIEAISGFLAEARKRLVPYNVFLSADIFGYVCWNLNDTGIGQRLEQLAPHLDYISPMLYPSGFQFGIPGYRMPVAYPYEIVGLSLKRAQERTGLAPGRFRPWLQAFKDYAFDRRPFGAKEIQDQIRAGESFGSNGWMLWNPRNVYSAEGLKP